MNQRVKTYDELLEDFYRGSLSRSRDLILRDWMKPRIKRVAGAWVCTGRGFSVFGVCPKGAYALWVLAKTKQEIYANRLRENQDRLRLHLFASPYSPGGRKC